MVEFAQIFEGKQDIVDLDLMEKMALLSQVAQELLDKQVDYGEISARHAQMRAEITVLKEVKSALQSGIRAEQRM